MPTLPPISAPHYGEPAVMYGHGPAGAGWRDGHSDGFQDHGAGAGDFGSEHSGGSQGSGHSGGSGRPEAPEARGEEQPRRPCCSISSCGRRTVAASVEELERVLVSMKCLTLRDDVIVGGELVNARSHLIRIGNKWRRRGVWDITSEIEQNAKEQLETLIAEEQGARLVFKCPRQPFPWIITLKCPCLVFCFDVLLIAALCVMGISSAVSIDTNFDSFMDSDSQSSLYYNAFLDAIADQKPQGRRLQSSGDRRTMWQLTDRVRESGRRAFRNVANGPVLDDTGRWYPLRYVARAAFPSKFRDADAGTWIYDNSTRRLAGTALYKKFMIQFTYATTKDDSILSSNYLTLIHKFERKLKQLPQWQKLCDTAEASTKSFCSPGLSLVNFAFAMRSPQPSPATATTLYFNGSGTKMLPLEISVDLAKGMGILDLIFPTAQAKEQHFKVQGLPCNDLSFFCSHYKAQGQCQPFAEHETYMQDFCPKTCGFCGQADAYGKHSHDPAAGEVITSIRSNFQFQSFCCNSADADRGLAQAKLQETWNEFIAKVVEMVPEEQESTEDVRILYTGDGLEGFEAMAAVKNDMLWAAGSYGFVLFYATLHTRSIFLSTMGLFLVMLSIPSALSVFSMASGMESVSLMSCLSIFIVIGLGSDMLFVYTDFWKQSIQHSRDPVKRLKFTYTQAACSTAATTFTTAMSFLANLASVLRPLREFGFFMGACVVSAWLIVFLGYPPILVMGERCHRRLRHTLGRHSVVEPLAQARHSVGRRSVNALSRRSSVAMAAMLDPEKKGVGEMHQNLLGTRFADFLRDWKCCLLVVFSILTLGSLGMAFQNLEQAGGVPQIFPSDHNQVLGKKYDEKFLSFDKDIAMRAGVSATECTDIFGDCTQFKCDTTGRTTGSASNCACYPHGQKSGACTRPYKMRLAFRVVGRQGLPLASVTSANYTAALMTQFPNAKRIIQGDSNIASFQCLADNWETGRQLMATMVRPRFYEVILRDLDPGEQATVCTEQQVCYCGMERCEGSRSAVGYGSLKLGPSGRRLQDPGRHPVADPLAGRQLSEGQVRPEDVVDVNVICGMKVVGESPLLGVSKEKPYEFDVNFNLQDPWAQRRFEGLCKNAKEDKELKIWKTRCWLLGFRDYWIAKGKDWPVRPVENMDAEVHWYANNMMTDSFQTTTFMWFKGQKVQATYVTFLLSVSKTVGSGTAMDLMKKWDSYVQNFNGEAPSAIKGVWHASKLWVRAEAEKVILDSTLVTLGISLGCVFLGVVLFTRSIHLAFLVMIIVMSIIICLLFFMTVMMNWPIGAIEVLSLIVFVGFAVDYCLHVAHKYHTCHINSVKDIPPEEEADVGPQRSVSSPKSSKRTSIKVEIDDKPDSKVPRRSDSTSVLLSQNRPEERFSRTRYALERMGGAVVGSAFTTVGCAAFLLPCQLAIFTKIGSVVMAVTVFAILYTLLPLPALLMAIGPCGNDMQAFINLIAKRIEVLAKHGMERRSDAAPVDNDWNMPRRYVLHMPNRSMSAVGPGIPATRTRVTATG